MALKNDSIIPGDTVNWKKLFLYGVPIGFTVLFVLFLLSLHWISSDVMAISKKAQQLFEGDNVEALSAALESDKLTFKEKNRIIWALGEIGDKRALPVLEKIYTGEPCPKPCGSSQHICQYGIKKAI